MYKLLLVLLSSTAFASPEISPPVAGKYSFQGAFTVPMKLHYEVVYAFTDAGKVRLKELMGQKNECWNKGRDTYLCKAFQSTEGAADFVRDRVNNLLQGKDLVLGELRGEPSLISKGTDVAEYEVPQEAQFNGKTYETYRWFVSRGHWSVRLGETTEAQFNWDTTTGMLSQQLEVFHQETRTEYSDYIVDADFLRM